MKVKIHKLFQYLLETTDTAPEAIVGFSLSEPPLLGAYLDDLDPKLSLDWNGRDFRGMPELREHVLTHAGLTGVCSSDHVLITAGAAEANYLALMQLLQPGDEIVMEMPGWPQAEVLASAKGITIVKIPRLEEEGWLLPLDRVALAVNEKTKMIFITNPNNPTGALLKQAELEELVRIADNVGAWLLVDEVYAGLEWDGPRAPAIAGMYARGITTGSVSKALGLQGLRTGWMICTDPELMIDAVVLRENASEIMNIMGEVIAEVALRPDRYGPAIEKARTEGRANLEQMAQWVDTQEALSWVAPRAGLIGLGRLPDGVNGDDFAQRLLAEPFRTFILPGSVYGYPQHVRLGVGGGASVNLAEGLRRVALALENQG